MSFGQRDSTVPSLYKRPRPSGAVWAVRARQRGTGKVVTVTIGKSSLVPVQEARKIARGHLYDLSQGINPNEANQERRAAEKAAKEIDEARDISLGDAIKRYLSYGQRKPRTIEDIHATIQRNFSDWLSIPARAITQTMVEDRFNEIKARAAKRRAEANRRMLARGATPRQFHSPPGQGEAQRAFRYLSAILNPLLDKLIDDQPILKVNPVKTLRHIKATHQLKPSGIWTPPKFGNCWTISELTTMSGCVVNRVMFQSARSRRLTKYLSCCYSLQGRARKKFLACESQMLTSTQAFLRSEIQKTGATTTYR